MACYNIIPSDAIAQILQGPSGATGPQGAAGLDGASTGSLPVAETFTIGTGNLSVVPTGMTTLSGSLRVHSSPYFYSVEIDVRPAFDGTLPSGQTFPEISFAFASLLPGNPITAAIQGASYGAIEYKDTLSIEHAAVCSYNSTTKVLKIHIDQIGVSGTHQIRGGIIIPKIA